MTTEQDYGRMLTTWDQRARRDKITIKKINFPVPTTGEDLYGLLEGAITPRTKVLHFCHITNLTGQIFPVQNLARMARARGIITIVDGAHAAAHFPFKLRDLEMDYYGTSLHKWLLAPTGTGFLYVRRDRIAKTWPMQAAPERDDNDIRKFEEIGTSPAATKAAINEALAFHQAIGTERVAARLRYLTLRWANKLKANPRVVIHTGLDQVYGVACVGIKDIPAPQINAFMWDKYRIITTAINRPEYNGIRVTPNIYTPLEEIDTFIAAMEDLLKNGLPATASGIRDQGSGISGSGHDARTASRRRGIQSSPRRRAVRAVRRSAGQPRADESRQLARRVPAVSKRVAAAPERVCDSRHGRPLAAAVRVGDSRADRARRPAFRRR